MNLKQNNADMQIAASNSGGPAKQDRPRLPYRRPQLNVYGDLTRLTQGGGGTDTDANLGSTPL